MTVEGIYEINLKARRMFSIGGLRRIVNLRVSLIKLSPSNPSY